MFNVEDILVGVANTADNPKITNILLNPGIIHRVDIMFPSGCAGTIKTAIYLGGHQLYPTNPKGVFSSDRETISFKDYQPIFRGLTELTIKSWNVGASYPHNITVRIGVLPEEQISVARALFQLAEQIEQLQEKIRTYF